MRCGSFENVENKKNISKIAYFRLFNSQSAVENPSKTASKGLFWGFVERKSPLRWFSTGDVERFSTFRPLFFRGFPHDIPSRRSGLNQRHRGALRAFPHFPQALIRLLLRNIFHSFLIFACACPSGPLGARRIKEIADLVKTASDKGAFLPCKSFDLIFQHYLF